MRSLPPFNQDSDLYRLFFEHIPHAVLINQMIYDEKGEPIDFLVLDVNHSFEKHTGIKKEDIIGRKISDIEPNLDQALFTPNGGEIRLEIDRNKENHQAIINIQDNGEGISPKFLPDLFKTFSQGDKTLHRIRGGLGLGLAIVNSMVELHDVIISDIGLPDMSGYQVGMEIGKLDELKDTVMIAMSGYAQTEDIKLSKEAGFDIHLGKPVSIGKLKMTLDNFF